MDLKSNEIRVAVIGAGIAGLTTALRLSQRGYDVTVYEKESILGGNLSSTDDDGVYQDVYPHMFSSWYTNFWEIFERDLGLEREAHFEARYGVKLLLKEHSEYLELRSPNSLQDALANLRSGVLPLPDMFLWGYSMLDLASQPFHPGEFLSRYSVNGFLNSRHYATELTARLHDLVLMEIWSVHGDQTSAQAYKDFVKHTFAFPRSVPFAWMLKGSLAQKIIDPLKEKLEELGCTIKTGHRVETVRVEVGAVEIKVEDIANRKSDWEKMEYAVLAVPPEALGKLVTGGDPGYRIVDRLPGLSEVRRLQAEPVAVLDLYFKVKLPNIPKDHVGLSGSGYNLTFLDLSQLWVDDPNMRDGTVLVLAASDFWALPSDNDNEDAYLLIKRLHEYLPVFNPGTCWEDPNSDIDWTKSHFRKNLNNRLFINQVGSGEWRPQTSYDALPQVLFAGDTVPTDVSMATVEAAVLSGLKAAQAVWQRTPLGNPVEIAELPGHSDAAFLAMKLAFTPYAYMAKWWSSAFAAVPHLARGDFVKGFAAPMAEMLSLPYSYVGEWTQTAFHLWESVVSDRRKRP